MFLFCFVYFVGGGGGGLCVCVWKTSLLPGLHEKYMHDEYVYA